MPTKFSPSDSDVILARDVRSSQNAAHKPAPILKREKTSKYNKPQWLAPIVFHIEEERPSPRGPATLVIAHRVQATPKMEELYDAVAEHLGLPRDLFRLFHRNTKQEIVEIASDWELSQCVAEASGNGAIPHLSLVVIEVGWLGRFCIFIGGAALALHRSGKRICRRLGNALLDDIFQYVDSSYFRSPTTIKLPWQQRSMLSHPYAAFTFCAGVSLSFLFCSMLLDRVRAGMPRMAYKPTRHLVALNKTRTTLIGRNN
jgi:hypothetical protein